eukprot:scaffold107556_cov45-Phaeocystis_antarctica.AAC.1
MLGLGLGADGGLAQSFAPCCKLACHCSPRFVACPLWQLWLVVADRTGNTGRNSARTALHLVAADDTSTTRYQSARHQLPPAASLGVPQHAQQAARVARSRLAAPECGDGTIEAVLLNVLHPEVG